jgi:hypothetical protein
MAPIRILFCSAMLVALCARAEEFIPLPPPPTKAQRTGKTVTESDYFELKCKVFINADGSAKTVEVLSTKPPMDLNNHQNKKLVDAVVNSAMTWTFNPNLKDGKPIAGYAIVPVHVDLAEPFKIGGT